MKQYFAHSKAGQTGAALAISLILLLVMTIVGITAMDGARLEINMAGRMQDEQIALRRGEKTLLDAESRIDALEELPGRFEFTSLDDEEDGFYEPGYDLRAAGDYDWSTLKSIKGPEHSDNASDDDDAVVIQYLGTQAIPGGDLGVDGDAAISGEEAHVYRIITRSATGAKSVRIIESIYTTFDGP